jgi:hypothetical protein
MRRRDPLQRLVLGACAGAVSIGIAANAGASNPLEYPDNGAAAFSRGGAWLATGTDPIAAHYNPAAMATQSNGLSLDFLFAYNKVCFARKNPGNQPTGPAQGEREDVGAGARYIPVCNDSSAQPRIIPSLGIVWRATDRLAFGFAVVPPATYGAVPGEWPDMTDGRLQNGQRVRVPAPYRWLSVGQRSTILHPTFSVGFELARGFRIGAGFVWSLGVIDADTMSQRTVYFNDKGDRDDVATRARIRTKDMFVPGAVVSIHWSITRHLDASVWGRWIDAINGHQGHLDLISNYFDATQGYRARAPVCFDPDVSKCAGKAVADDFGENSRHPASTFRQFRFMATPPEVRAGIRFHMPRSDEPVKTDGPPVRDPLRDDLFDIELNGSYTMNSVADTIKVRFEGNADGTAKWDVRPEGALPPRADRPTGYKDSYGVRLGGQYNLIASKFGIRAGTWYETEAAPAAYLNIAPVPAARGGFGGGIVFRQGSFDFSIGYQRHYSMGMDNKGQGAIRGNTGTLQGADGPFSLTKPPPGTTNEEQFRTRHFINGGKVTQSANVFTIGGAFRF